MLSVFLFRLFVSIGMLLCVSNAAPRWYNTEADILDASWCLKFYLVLLGGEKHESEALKRLIF